MCWFAPKPRKWLLDRRNSNPHTMAPSTQYTRSITQDVEYFSDVFIKRSSFVPAYVRGNVVIQWAGWKKYEPMIIDEVSGLGGECTSGDGGVRVCHLCACVNVFSYFKRLMKCFESCVVAQGLHSPGRVCSEWGSLIYKWTFWQLLAVLILGPIGCIMNDNMAKKTFLTTIS